MPTLLVHNYMPDYDSLDLPTLFPIYMPDPFDGITTAAWVPAQPKVIL